MNKQILSAIVLTAMAATAQAAPKHGFAVLGELKYPADFSHFDYVNPSADKGGNITFMGLGSFDSVNPFILKGKKASGSDPFSIPFQTNEDFFLIPFESLMIPSGDEPDSFYGLVAKNVEIADDGMSVTFQLRSEARFHDGTSISAEDVAYSFNILKEKGHPSFGLFLKDVTQVEIPAAGEVRYHFRPGAQVRDLPSVTASLPILSEKYYDSHDITKTSLDGPLGSGPYKITKIDPGRSITYSRVKDHWAKDLPVYRGRFNFDEIRWIYFRDFDISLEALFAGKLDFREEYTSRAWASQYNAPAIKDGRVKREELEDGSPSGFQVYMINTRHEKFADRRTRKALNYAFDYEWTNKNLFYGAYARTLSIFQNTDLMANGEPSDAELALLEPHRDMVAPEVFGPSYQAPVTDGSGNPRQNLRTARKLFAAAGWQLREGKLVDAAGQPFKIEFLTYDSRSERVVAPFIRNLQRLGVAAKIRLVDSAQFQARRQKFDFDIISARFSGSITPGFGLRNVWHSSAADTTGSLNFPGVKSKAVDVLIDRVTAATSRDELRTAASALDRVIMAGQYIVPQWHLAKHRLAYWDKFGRPAAKPKYTRGVWDLWWIDKNKAAALSAKRN